MGVGLLDAGSDCLPVLRQRILSIRTPAPHGKIAVIYNRQTLLPKHLRKARVAEELWSLLLSRAVRPETGGNSDISDCPAHSDLSTDFWQHWTTIIHVVTGYLRFFPDHRSAHNAIPCQN